VENYDAKHARQKEDGKKRKKNISRFPPMVKEKEIGITFQETYQLPESGHPHHLEIPGHTPRRPQKQQANSEAQR
jgi:hypothetical protein